MKNITFRLLGWMAALCALLLIAAFLVYSRLPDMLSDSMSQKLKVAVEIGDVRLSSHSIAIDDLEIANVPGGKLTKALSVKNTVFDAPLTNYIKDSITIEEITLDQVYLGLEFASATSTNGNWSTLIGNLNENPKAPPSSKDKTKEAKVLIKKIVVSNIQTDVVYDKDGGKIIKLKPIDRIELTNINSEDGVPSDQIMRSVLGQMLQSVFTQENLKNMLKGVLQEPENPWNSLIKPFEGLFSDS
jgi:uncharacterized protein involved in outer membrane biogenesis